MECFEGLLNDFAAVFFVGWVVLCARVAEVWDWTDISSFSCLAKIRELVTPESMELEQCVKLTQNHVVFTHVVLLGYVIVTHSDQVSWLSGQMQWRRPGDQARIILLWKGFSHLRLEGKHLPRSSFCLQNRGGQDEPQAAVDSTTTRGTTANGGCVGLVCRAAKRELTGLLPGGSAVSWEMQLRGERRRLGQRDLICFSGEILSTKRQELRNARVSLVPQRLLGIFLVIFFDNLHPDKKVIHALYHPTISFLSLSSQELVFWVLKLIASEMAGGLSEVRCVQQWCLSIAAREEKLRNSHLSYEVPFKKDIYK